MNKSALKSFATEARRELLEKVQLQARKIGITPDAIKQASVESSDAIFIDGRQLSDTERKQRNKLIARINEIGYDRVMEEAAYTWFNRFIALRYMEVNDYLPTKVRVISSVNPDSTEPDIFKEALNLDLPIDKELVYNLKIDNKTDELFKYLIKVHCNDLNRYMPFMFETIEGYMEILFPEGLLGTDAFVRKMTDVDTIPEEDWTKVEIVGWLYQYYISEENERVIKAKKRYKAEEIPFATQLFTPEWIVRYMVQNALGRFWIESHPEHRDLIQNWEFFLENPNPEPDFEEKLAPYINKELNVEDIKCFDPAMGSGHILAYMFDVLYEIYSKCGYMDREIPRLIIEKNIYGLDIDERAFQLASFTVVMKALQYNKRFLRSIERDGLEMNLAAIQETNNLTDDEIAFLAGEISGEKYNQMYEFINQFKYAKEIGSLSQIVEFDKAYLEKRLTAIQNMELNLFDLELKNRVLVLFKDLIKQANIIKTKYDVFITNPPYAGRKYLTTKVTEYLDKVYSTEKNDLFSAFMKLSMQITKRNGQIGLITPYVWMFISSYEKLRESIISNATISSLLQLEYNAFEAAMVPVCTFTMRNYSIDLPGDYVKLSDFKGVENQPLKTLEAVKNPYVSYRFLFNQKNYVKIPGSPIAYWTGSLVHKLFEKESSGEVIQLREGIHTGNNELFLRYWFEVNYDKLVFNACSENDVDEQGVWIPYNKGGSYRKWYGNNELVIAFDKNNRDKMNQLSGHVRPSKSLYFKQGVTWSALSSGNFSLRYYPDGFLFDSKGQVAVGEKSLEIMALFNTSIYQYLADLLMPTLDYKCGDVKKLPYLPISNSNFLKIAKENISIAKNDWDSFETSWDFKKHPILNFNYNLITMSFNELKDKTNANFEILKDNQKQLNLMVIDEYKLEEIFQADIEESDVTIFRIVSIKSEEEKKKRYIIDLQQSIKSFISYSIGIILGRFSLDEEGLVYAGGEFDLGRYKTFPADADNVLPILAGAYFEDDIVSRFVEFVRVTFSEETLEENLDFVADALGRKKNETARETIRRYFLNDFYKDHVQTYKKRPIYWLFTSGKEKAFNCLIYMHRYDKTTLSRIRTDYLHEVQIRMDAEKNDLLNIINSDSTVKEITAAKKELKSLEKKIDELKRYDELLHHMADQQIEIDLDDGVVHNYGLFEGLVAKI